VVGALRFAHPTTGIGWLPVTPDHPAKTMPSRHLALGKSIETQ
jgi:hypothetical protein